jgi:hypothetical protein
LTISKEEKEDTFTNEKKPKVIYGIISFKTFVVTPIFTVTKYSPDDKPSTKNISGFGLSYDLTFFPLLSIIVNLSIGSVELLKISKNSTAGLGNINKFMVFFSSIIPETVLTVTLKTDELEQPYWSVPKTETMLETVGEATTEAPTVLLKIAAGLQRYSLAPLADKMIV